MLPSPFEKKRLTPKIFVHCQWASLIVLSEIMAETVFLASLFAPNIATVRSKGVMIGGMVLVDVLVFDRRCR